MSGEEQPYKESALNRADRAARVSENEVSLRAFLLAEIEATNRDGDARWEAHEHSHRLEDKALDAALAAQQRAVDAALTAVNRETTTAAGGIDKLAEQSVNFVTREQVTEILSQRVLDLIASIRQAKEAHAEVHRSEQVAVGKVEAASEVRFSNQNEFRQQLRDQAATLLTRTEGEQRFVAMAAVSDARYQGLLDRLRTIETTLATQQGQQAVEHTRDERGITQNQWIGSTAVLVLAIIVTIVIAILNLLTHH